MPQQPNPFHAAAAAAAGRALAVDPALFAVTAPPRPELGDFAVGCFPAAKALKQAAPALAARAAAEFSPNELLEGAAPSGPFVNYRARRPALFRHLFLGQLVPAVGAGHTVCIDYSSPNIAKHLAYHHIRSTVIGQALVNLHRALGYRVVGINHLGDWGTTHGMMLAASARWGAPEPLTVDGMNELYVRFNKEIEADPAAEAQGRAWFKRLEDGDPEARAIWQRFRDVSLAEFQAVYDALGVSFDEVRGESEYEAAMPAVLEEMAAKGLSTESQGALVVPLDDLGMPPLLLRKQDGASLYATRDLAAAEYRWERYRFARNLYVVDRGQSLHFKQLFAVLARAGHAWADRCQHVPFGLVRIGGKKTGTRKGNVVLLKEVLREAGERAAQRIRELNPDLPDPEGAGRVVGVGAVVFANLVAQRDKDVDFEWDDVLSLEGDSGPYLQYAHARCSAMLRKAGETPPADTDPAPLGHHAEWALALALLAVGDVLQRAAESNEPHVVCHYLLGLAGAFSRWYTAGNGDPALRVLCDDPPTRRARLALTAATRDVLRQGMELLGMQAPEAM